MTPILLIVSEPVFRGLLMVILLGVGAGLLWLSLKQPGLRLSGFLLPPAIFALVAAAMQVSFFLDYLEAPSPTTLYLTRFAALLSGGAALYAVWRLALGADRLPLLLQLRVANRRLAREIAERTQRGKALEDSESRLRLAQEISGIGYWSFHPMDGALAWSDETYRIHGYDKGSVRPSQALVQGAIETCEDWDGTHFLFCDLASVTAPFSEDLCIRRPDGASRHVRVIGRQRRDENGAIESIFGVIQDVTDKKQAEEDRLLRQTAEAAAAAKNELLGQMGHELLTPMNAVLGFTELLKLELGEKLSERHRAYLDDMVVAGRHLSRMITEVMRLSRTESDMTVLEEEVFDPGQLLRDVQSSVSLMAEQAGVHIYVHAPEGLGAYWADRTKLFQALLNLASNAVKYNAEGGEVALRVAALDETTLRFTVADTGIGIDDAQRGDAFTPFNRLGREKTDIPGTGIGLTITRKLVDAMSGQVDFTSHPGVGTQFWIDVPVTPAHPGAGKSADGRPVRQAS